MTTRRAPVAALLLVAGLTLSSCVRVPDTGPVVEAKQRNEAPSVDTPYNNPPPPKPGASPGEIVTGFFDAMTATPLQTRAAKAYLLDTGSVWQPQRNVITYTRIQTTVRRPDRVEVQLRGADRVGAGGQWLGRLSRGASRFSFPMRQQNGEWRIASAPDALIVPETFYEQAFQDAAIYFFDPTGRILVPEIVHVPSGQQLSTSLVHALLLGPRPELGGVARTFIPPGLSVSGVVVSDGQADVTLNGGAPTPLSTRTIRLLLSQLSWTLRQDPTVQTFRVTIAGNQVTDSSGASIFRVVYPDANHYDPAVQSGSAQLYALRRGLLVSGEAANLTPTTGPFGQSPQGIGPFAVSLHDSRVAGVTASALLLGPVRGPEKLTEVRSGPGLLRPAWDFAGRLWDVQDLPSGAVVGYYAHGREHVVDVPGVTGRDVRRFLVSRDGSRLVAVLRGAARDRIVVSRIRYTADGRAVSGTRARAIRWATGASQRVRDIGWTSPTSIAVLDQVSPAQAEVRLLDIDGSITPSQTHAIVVRGVATGLATSPAGQTPFAVQPNDLFDLAQVDTTTTQQITHLHHITYVG